MTSIKSFIYKIIERLKCRNDKKGLFTQLLVYENPCPSEKGEKKLNLLLKQFSGNHKEKCGIRK